MTTAGAMPVGVLGVGVHLPPAIRDNDWWPAAHVDRWRAQQARTMAAIRAMPPPATAAAREVVAAILALEGDPFEGARQRRVVADDVTATDIEAAAAEQALAQAGVAAGAIDVLLTHSAVPEYQLGNTACELHARLGLGPGCLALEAQASAYSFLAQLELATAMLESGRARHALLVQSAISSRLLDPADPVSARIGDAASAVVVGRVGRARGVLGSYHVTDSAHPRTLIASVPGGRWHDGRSLLHIGDPGGARASFASSVEQACQVIAGALAAAAVDARDVDFIACHHATPWLGPLVQAHAGLGHARGADLFARTAYVFATSVPLILAAGIGEGALVDGDLVVMVAAGTGMVRGATVLRWGTGS